MNYYGLNRQGAAVSGRYTRTPMPVASNRTIPDAQTVGVAPGLGIRSVTPGRAMPNLNGMEGSPDFGSSFSGEVDALGDKAFSGDNYGLSDAGAQLGKKSIKSGLASAFGLGSFADAASSLVSGVPGMLFGGIVGHNIGRDMRAHHAKQALSETMAKLKTGLISDDEAKQEARGILSKYGGNPDAVGGFSKGATVSGRLSDKGIGNPGAYGGNSGTNSIGPSGRLGDKGIGNPGAYGGSSAAPKGSDYGGPGAPGSMAAAHGGAGGSNDSGGGYGGPADGDGTSGFW